MGVERHAALSDQVLRELQASFASLAVTQEDVLMTGAVGVASLVEAAKGAAMDAELVARQGSSDVSLCNVSALLCRAPTRSLLTTSIRLLEMLLSLVNPT